MRYLFFFLLLLTVTGVNAQVNRSANELARETTRDYLTTRIFANQDYHPVSYDALLPWPDKRSRICWTLVHEFRVTHRQQAGFVKPAETVRTYKFLFYLDKQMKVMRASASSIHTE